MGAPMKIDLKSKVNAPSPAAAFSLMLGGSAQKDIRELEIGSLIPYPDQPFKPYSDERLHELAEDIRANGVLSPVIVRPHEEGFQILAGHNRVNASKLAGLDTVPCIVKPFDDATAQLVMVNSNLNQRQELLPSEKAFAYKLQMDAMKRQGKRTDLTSDPMDRKLNHPYETEPNSNEIGQNSTSNQFGWKLNHADETDPNNNETGQNPTSNQVGRKLASADSLAKQANTSATQVRRFIRLTHLSYSLLDKVDIGELPIVAGVELSYLDTETQERLVEYLMAYPVKLDIAKASILRAQSCNGYLTRADIARLLSPAAKPTKEKTSLKFQSSELIRYFPDRKPKEIEREILKILEQHFSTQSGNS